MIYMLDFNGNETKKWHVHSESITEISIDIGGEYMGSCSNDGRIVINALYTTDSQEHTYNRPLSSLSLDPEYHRKKTQQFCTGGKSGVLSLNSKGSDWLIDYIYSYIITVNNVYWFKAIV